MTYEGVEESCYIVDIIACITIFCIGVATLGVGFILFLIYIPISIYIHWVIRGLEHNSRKRN